MKTQAKPRQIGMLPLERLPQDKIPLIAGVAVLVMLIAGAFLGLGGGETPADYTHEGYFALPISQADSSDCVAHWTLDNSNGLIDACSSTYNMTNNSAVSGETGAFNEAYYINQSASAYLNDTDLDLSSSFTICTWYYPVEIGATNPVFDKRVAGQLDYYANYVMNVNSENKVLFLIGGGGTSWFYTTTDSAVTDAADEWYHLCGVFNDTANTLAVYVNGSLEPSTDTGTSTISPYQNDGEVRFGRYSGVSTIYANATMDEVWVFSTALTSGEINNIMDYNAIEGSLTMAINSDTGKAAIAFNRSTYETSWTEAQPEGQNSTEGMLNFTVSGMTSGIQCKLTSNSSCGLTYYINDYYNYTDAYELYDAYQTVNASAAVGSYDYWLWQDAVNATCSESFTLDCDVT